VAGFWVVGVDTEERDAGEKECTQRKEVNNNKVSKYKSCSFASVRVLRLLLPACKTLPAAQWAGPRRSEPLDWLDSYVMSIIEGVHSLLRDLSYCFSGPEFLLNPSL